MPVCLSVCCTMHTSYEWPIPFHDFFICRREASVIWYEISTSTTEWKIAWIKCAMSVRTETSLKGYLLPKSARNVINYFGKGTMNRRNLKTEVSLWKRMKCFPSSGTTPGKIKKLTVILNLCLRKIWQENRMIIVTTPYRFQNVFRPHYIRSRCFKISPVWKAFFWKTPLPWQISVDGSPNRVEMKLHFRFCPRVPVHKSKYKRPNNTQQLTNDSWTKKEQWLFPCEPVHQDRTAFSNSPAYCVDPALVCFDVFAGSLY